MSVPLEFMFSSSSLLLLLTCCLPKGPSTFPGVLAGLLVPIALDGAGKHVDVILEEPHDLFNLGFRCHLVLQLVGKKKKTSRWHIIMFLYHL